VPVWHSKAQKYVDEGKLTIVGLVQEQHRDRCRLFLQWRKIGWPVLWDPINLSGQSAVPIVTAIDEHGIVRIEDPNPDTIARDFLARSYPRPSGLPLVKPPAPPDLSRLRSAADSARTSAAWRELGDAQLLWGGPAGAQQAIESYRRAIALDPADAVARFRLGVAHRMRYDSPRRQPGDFQRALDAWQAALDLNPNQYIWRRRIQQYGPRLDKPYPFYDWVAQARADIAGRGERPVGLSAEPTGAEIAAPARSFVPAADGEEPDRGGRIVRDTNLIRIETAVAPATVRPGATARVHVVMSPDASRRAHWNNEAEPLRLWIQPPEGWSADQHLIEAPSARRAASTETRDLSFEVRVAESAMPGIAMLRAYALYYVCVEVNGQCLFRRRDITVPIRIAPAAGDAVGR